MCQNWRLVFVAAVAVAACSKNDGDDKAARPAAAIADAAGPVAVASDSGSASDGQRSKAGSARATSSDGDADAESDAKSDADGAAKGPPKNLRILPKVWSRKQVVAVMKRFKKALGVDCKFCHDPDDHAADTNKHKKIARDMMRMTAAMNQQFFGGKSKLSCWTCHKGKKEP